MTKRPLAVLLMTAMSAPLWGQQSLLRSNFELSADQVARTLSKNGIQVKGQQVSLLAHVVAAEPEPLLDVLTFKPVVIPSSAKGTAARSLVKLACHESGKCLPFYAIVTWPPGPPEGPSGQSDTAVQFRLAPNLPIMMRAGTHATLLMDDERSHIQVAVVSLENGVVGHRIRVASPDHKHIFVGEVVSASLLKRSY